jgi:hypothetical protein
MAAWLFYNSKNGERQEKTPHLSMSLELKFSTASSSSAFVSLLLDVAMAVQHGTVMSEIE